MTRWGDEKTLYFICLYRRYECLWNPRSPFYKNKLMRRSAYKSILISFNDKHLDMNNVKTKIKNLRSVYHTELKKVKDSMRPENVGPLYKPSLSWFDEMHAFLGDSLEDHHDLANQTANNEARLEASATNAEQATGNITVRVEHNITNEDLLEVKLEREHDATIEVPLHSDTCIITSELPRSTLGVPRVSNQRRNCRKKKSEGDPILDALQRLENSVSNIMELKQRQPVLPQNEDEFHVFGLSMAAQLRQLPLHIAISTQSQIQNLISEARLSTIFSDTMTATAVTVKTENISE